MRRRTLPLWAGVLAPVLFGVAMVGLWQLWASAKHVPDYFLPSPAHIWTQFHANFRLVLHATLHTGWNALRGLLIGTLLGVIGALLGNALRSVREMAAPLVLAVSAIPIAALGPVLNEMFNATFNTSRVIIAAIAVSVPVYINTLRGLAQVRPVHRELMRAYSARPVTTARTVTLPTAIPYLFTGIRIGSPMAVISALIAEFFGGPLTGLANQVTANASSGRYAAAWAGVLGSIVLGLVFYVLGYALERWFNRHQAA
jgi:NitT/TauT family transport system permease protein